MILLHEYFGRRLDHPDATPERFANAERLLSAVEKLELLAMADGVEFPDNPATGTGVSGQEFGGFRPQNCKVGASNSAHKEGLAVDLYDPANAIDAWCMDNQNLLVECGIYIEHPNHTPRWSHWSIKPPRSGKHVFIP